MEPWERRVGCSLMVWIRLCIAGQDTAYVILYPSQDMTSGGTRYHLSLIGIYFNHAVEVFSSSSTI
jgi:hypothetical protein